jgi:hypothetical protein
MTDFEERLRAAMAAAAGPAPTGLLAGIRRRHRRYVMRLTAAFAAMGTGLAVAVPLAVHGIEAGRSTPASGATAPATRVPDGGGVVPPVPHAGPDTALRDCMNSNGGEVSADWKRQSVQAGPVWFMFARPPAGAQAFPRVRTGTVTASALAIAISYGHTAIVTAAPSVAGRFRFLASFNGNNQPYTLREGSRALKLVGCPAVTIAPGIPAGDAPGLTIWWQGYVTNLRGCIPLDVRVSPATKVTRVVIAAPGCKR